MKPKLHTVITILFLLALVFPDLARAVPGQMNYTGYLTKNSKPVSSGSTPLKVIIKVFKAATGGLNPEWLETHTKVHVKNGAFSLVLGQTK